MYVLIDLPNEPPERAYKRLSLVLFHLDFLRTVYGETLEIVRVREKCVERMSSILALLPPDCQAS